MRRVISKAKTEFKTLTIIVISALLGIGGILPVTASSTTIEINRPFVMEYRETTPVGSVSQLRLDYKSETEWLLTVVEGENLGYFIQSKADGSVVAGYPQWNEPEQISGPSEKKMLPAPYFAQRNPSAETVSDSDTAVAGFEDAGLSLEQKEAISQAAYRGNLPTSDLIILKNKENVAAYSRSIGVPLWIAPADKDTAYFEVVMLQ